jgi:hypothetical protein
MNPSQDRDIPSASTDPANDYIRNARREVDSQLSKRRFRLSKSAAGNYDRASR